MTREEAIELLYDIQSDAVYNILLDEKEAIDMAIEVLEQETVLDKIRAEINSLNTYGAKFTDGLSIHVDKYSVLQIIDKYKAESEDKE